MVEEQIRLNKQDKIKTTFRIEWKKYILAAALAIVLAVLVQYVSHGKSRFHFDSKIYVSMANNYLKGDMFVSNMHNTTRKTKRLEFLRAPFYPMIIAGTSFVTGLSTIDSAAGLSLLFYTLGTFLLAIWLSRYFKTWIALLGTALGSIGYPIFMMAADALSEAMFFFVFVAIFLMLDIYREKINSNWLITGIGVFTALIFLIRYIGICVVPIVVGVVIINKRITTQQKIKHLIIYMLIFGIAAGGMAAINYAYTGYITGKRDTPSDVDLITNTGMALKVVSNSFWLLDQVLERSDLLYLIQISLFIALLALLLFLYKQSRSLVIIWLSVISYIGLIVTLRSLQTFSPINDRILGPSLPIISAVIIAFILSRIFNHALKGTKVILTSAFLIAIIVILISRFFSIGYTRNSSIWSSLYWTAPQYSQTLNYARSVTTESDVILGSREAMAIIMLPDSPEFVVLGHLDGKQLTRKGLKELVKNNGVKYLVFGFPDINITIKRYGPYVDRIMNQKKVKGIILVKEFDDGRVYDVSALK